MKKFMMLIAGGILSAALPLMAATEQVGTFTWTYRINGDTAEIYNGNYSTAISPKPTGSVTIPATLGGKSVTSIGDYAFWLCSSLTSVTIPNSVTNIGASAFSGCNGLTSVTIPQYVLDRQIRNVFAYAYSSITNVSYSSTITNIVSYAFYGCSSLTSVTIPNSVTSIGEYAFSYCGLTSVTIPDSVTNIGYDAFRGCDGLTSVTIPDSVTSIGQNAFQSCSGLTSVTIPSSVTSIGSDAFLTCSGLTSVHIADLAAWCRISFANSTANPLYYARNLYLNDVLITNLTIPTGITTVRNYAFYNCSGLTSVTIPDSVTSIRASAFSGCSGLTSVTIPDSVTSLSTTAFDGCGRLWTAWYRTLANSSASGGGSSGGGGAPAADPRYALAAAPADRAIASVTVDRDCAIDSFVLTDGKVYDTVLYVVNAAATSVHLTLPSGYVYVTPKDKTPLTIPANSMNLLTITRLAASTFLVTRQQLETVK